MMSTHQRFSSPVARRPSTKATQQQPHPPRGKIICTTWRRVAFGVLFFFAANLVFLISQIDLQDPSAAPEGSPLHDLLLSSMSRTRNTERIRSGQQQEQQQQGQPSMTVKNPVGAERSVDLPLQKPGLSDKAYIQRIQTLEKRFGAQSCRRKKDGQQQQTYHLNADFCSQPPPPPLKNKATTTTTTRSILYFNPLPRERILCDGTTTIPAKATIESTTVKCQAEEVGGHILLGSSSRNNNNNRLFPVTPDRMGKGMPPVRLEFDGVHPSIQAQEFPCDIPCMNRGNPPIVAQRFVESIDGGNKWTVTFSMEGPEYYRKLKINPDAYKQRHFYSTTSYQSEIPLPYFSWAEYNIHVPAVDYDKAIKGAAFLARNCKSHNHRERIVQELIDNPNIRADSLSTCLHNAEPPEGVNLAGSKNDIMKHYLFYLAFENQCTDDYITEKLWGPFESGVLPVYYGSPNVKEYVPNNSIILVDDFATTNDLAVYLHKVANNKTLYEWHQAWRSQPLPPHFHAKFDFTHVHSTCRTCRWAYARFYGLGWNHANQSIRELATPREPCLDAQGLLQKPVAEKWLSAATRKESDARSLLSLPVRRSGSSSNSSATCPLTKVSTLDINNGVLRRTVREQDGAIDFWIEQLDASQEATPSVVLRLEVPFPTTAETEIKAKALKIGHIRLQNNQTRYTILTWPCLNVNIKVNESGGGTVEVPLVDASSLPLRLRILVEDIDTLHQGADEEENFFGQLMIDDFYNPVEAFVK